MILRAVHFINLDSRVDRKESFIKQMDNYGLRGEHVVIRHPAAKTNPGYIGCSLSHAQLLQSVLDADDGSRFAAVFEDDFMWKSDPETVDRTLKEFFESGVEWDVLLLAGSAWGLETSAGPTAKVKRCHVSQASTAYLVNRSYIPTLRDLFQQSASDLAAGKNYGDHALDKMWRRLQAKDKWFIAVPGLGREIISQSDITGETHAGYAWI